MIGSNASGNTIEVSNNQFAFVNGGIGANNTLELYTSGSSFNIDFTSLNQNVAKNFDYINLGVSSSGGNSVTLNVQDVFDMTNSGNSHTLQISQSGVSGSAVNVVTSNINAALDFHFVSSASGVAGQDQVYQGSYNGGTNNVTLVIHDQATSGAGHIAVATV